MSRAWTLSKRLRIKLMCVAALAVVFAPRPLAGGQPKQGHVKANAPPPGAQNRGAKKAYDPSDRYATREIEGWTVLVNKKFLAKEARLAKQTLALLREQLQPIVERVPAGAVKKLRTIHFWVEENEPHHPCMTYHPDPEWLQKNDMNPDKARCVELSNVRNFLEWTREQPWMVLHELTHGYHHQFLKRGFENPEIKKAFDDAVEAKRYESVLRSNGKTERAYAATNPMEFFAEASEAYFGKNDFYPFDRAELKQHDPETFALVDKLWRKN